MKEDNNIIIFSKKLSMYFLVTTSKAMCALCVLLLLSFSVAGDVMCVS